MWATGKSAFSGTATVGDDLHRQRVATGGELARHVDPDIEVRFGTGRQRLSGAEGTHSASFNPAFTFYLDTWSDLMTPPQVRLHRADGSEVRVVDPNPVPALADYRLGRPELVRVPTRDGFPMEALLLRPPDFDPSKIKIE